MLTFVVTSTARSRRTLTHPAFSLPSLRALSCERKPHLFSFHSFPHSLGKTPGCHHDVYQLPASTSTNTLSPLESALAGELRVGFQGLYLQTLTWQKTAVG